MTISQIAELAQVSKGTVSKVMNKHPGIRASTRERILKLVDQLGYQPDASARALAMQKTGIIGFLIPHQAAQALSGYYWASVLSGLSQEAARRNCDVMVLTPSQEGDVHGVLTKVLRRKILDGMIIGSELLDTQGLSTLVLNKIPFVLLGQNPEFQHWCVDMDSRQGTRLMLDHMVGRGYRRIGAIMGPSEYPYNQARAESYLRTMATHGLVATPPAHSAYSTPEVDRILSAYLDRHPDLDALFVGAGGEFYLDVLAVLRKRSVEVPRFGLGVFDDYPFYDYFSPPVTAVRQPLQKAGSEALDLLLALMEGPVEGPRTRLLENTLVVRQSCGEV